MRASTSARVARASAAGSGVVRPTAIVAIHTHRCVVMPHCGEHGGVGSDRRSRTDDAVHVDVIGNAFQTLRSERGEGYVARGPGCGTDSVGNEELVALRHGSHA